MSSAQQAARSIRELEKEDWNVLEALERSMSRFESVPLRRIERETKLHAEQVEFRLGRLNYYGFVMSTDYGYIMNTSGLDVLALHSFVDRNLISGLGPSVGMGKESDVFVAINDYGEESVIKFYRIGRISFRATRKTRTYVSASSQHQWLSVNVGAAQKEAEGMTRAFEAGVNVPRFIARNRHAVLMSKVDGVMLYKCAREDIENPARLLAEVLENLRKAYTIAKIINCDISEYNTLFDGLNPWIIDWPQYVSISHSNANELIARDVSNALSFFKKRFGSKLNTDSAISFVTGKKGELEWNQT